MMIFRVKKLWRFGKWTEVTIDDQLPFSNRTKSYIFTQSKNGDEFWIALLEKAMAKVYGSYEALTFRFRTHDAIDLTGGIREEFPHTEYSLVLFRIIHECLKRRSLVFCKTELKETARRANVPEKRICSVTKAFQTNSNGFLLLILIIRNPESIPFIWNGPWSRTSTEFRSLKGDLRKLLLAEPLQEGEFLMRFEDYIDVFETTVVCNVPPGIDLTPLEIGADWVVSIMEGKWARGVSAGGPPYLKMTHLNPQFPLELKFTDDDSEKCTIIIDILQEYKVYEPKPIVSVLKVGFAIYTVHSHNLQPVLGQKFFKDNRPIIISEHLANLEHCKRYTLPRGIYLIVPSVIKVNQEGRFIMRVFTEKTHTIRLKPLWMPLLSKDNIRSYLECPTAFIVGYSVRYGFSVSVVLENHSKNLTKLNLYFGVLSKIGKDEKAEFYPIKARKECLVIEKWARAEAIMHIYYHEYGYHILKGGKMCATFQAFSGDDIFSDLREIELDNPSIDISADDFIKVGKFAKVKANFKNPLPVPLENGVIHIEGKGIEEKKEVVTGRIGPYCRMKMMFSLLPITPGKHTLTVTFFGNPLGSVEGVKEVEFLGPDEPEENNSKYVTN